MSTLTLNTKLAANNSLKLAFARSAANPNGSVADDLLEELAEAALNAQQIADAAAEDAAKAKDAFRTALEKAGKLDADTRAVGIVRTTIYPTKRFDETLARSLMTQKLQKECSKVVLDSKAVQAKVSPETYSQMQKVSGWTLKLAVDTGK